MDTPHRIDPLLEAVESTLALLRDYAGGSSRTDLSEPLPSLLEQCQQILAGASDPLTIRTVHHFACTGGTLISKCMAALPNTALLNEIDPLSTLMVSPTMKLFAPTDVLLGIRQCSRDMGEETLVRVFLGALEQLLIACANQGLRLILRDHSHSHFCTGPAARTRPTLREMVSERFPVRSVVTIRHPLDSYLSIDKLGWNKHFSPSSIEQYAQRYKLFLSSYNDVPIIKYEDFLSQPEAALAEICEILDLSFSPDALSLFPVIELSGDSGRKGDVISARARQTIPDELRQQLTESPSYNALCVQLGYEATV